MAEFPALPLFTDALLADCEHLSDAEMGVYLRILMYMWRAPECRIPNDSKWIARKFRRTVEQVETEVIPVLREFCSSDGNWWTQKRLKKEYGYVKKKSRKASASAKSRWNKEKDACERNATQQCDRNAPTPTPTPTTVRDTNVPLTEDMSSRSQAAIPTAKKVGDRKYTQEFEELFSLWPKNGSAKADAAKKHNLLLKSGESHAEIIHGARKYLEFASITDTPTCHLATFLNQRRWETDYDAALALRRNFSAPSVNGRDRQQGPYDTMLSAWAHVVERDEPNPGG